tara:strand:+ start:310 stop:738 length:429 start_codon:yes stop_codon:yes gene_type:complete
MTYDEKVHEAIRLSSNGNNDAWNYLSIISQVARVIDDLVDKPSEVDTETKYKLAQLLLVDLPSNSFFHTHKTSLLPLHLTSLNAWIDSNDWMEKDTTRKNYALVIRDQITELVMLVAYLTGGNEHMRNVSLKIRELFLKEEF